MTFFEQSANCGHKRNSYLKSQKLNAGIQSRSAFPGGEAIEVKTKQNRKL